MSDSDYNEWETEDLQSLLDEIAPILEERYASDVKISWFLRKENDDEVIV